MRKAQEGMALAAMVAIACGGKVGESDGTAAAVGAVTIFLPTTNGVVLGLTAWILAYAVEVAVLAPNVRRAWR